MIPFEGLLPYGIMITLMTIGGGVFGGFKAYENNGWRVRHSLDKWEEQMIDRDWRLTGKFRAQSGDAVAPEAFKTNSFWKIEKKSRWY